MSTTKNNLRSHHHCVYKITYHLVLVTKYRRKCFTKEILDRLHGVCKDICEKWDMKTVSSRLIRRDFSEHLAKFYSKPVMWTRAYCLLSAGGGPIEVIKQYIESQETLTK